MEGRWWVLVGNSGECPGWGDAGVLECLDLGDWHMGGWAHLVRIWVVRFSIYK